MPWTFWGMVLVLLVLLGHGAWHDARKRKTRDTQDKEVGRK
jgi:hypothetical protein